MTHRQFKDALYGQVARVGRAAASPRRLEMLELLAQAERTVVSLASEIGLSLANASQHLQALRHAALVEPRRQGAFVYYRLADPAIAQLAMALRSVAERRVPEIERLVQEHFGDRSDPEPVPMQDLLKRARARDVVLLDARPAAEYEAGHIAGAISVPIDQLQRRLRSLPADREYVAYCRGPYCVYADRAVAVLLRSGRCARRLLEGFPEWRAAGHPIAHGRGTRAAARPRRARRTTATTTGGSGWR